MARVAVFATALVIGVIGQALAAEPSGPTGFGDFSLTSTKEPIEVTSKQLEFDYKARRAVFKGDVQVVQGDIHLDSDTLTVRYSEKAGKQQVESVQADGKVKIKQGERVAKGDKAVFDQTSRKLILTGNAVLQDGPNQLTGDTVEVYPDQSKMEVKGENRRVKVLLFPERTPDATPAASSSPAADAKAEATPAAGDATAEDATADE
jgi:lipopolysaccharide export system protein LptA